MLNYFLVNWMPWYKQCYDLSLLEMNRSVETVASVTSIVMLSKLFLTTDQWIGSRVSETTTAIFANIESAEWIRRQRDNSSPTSQQSTHVHQPWMSVMRETVGKRSKINDWRSVLNSQSAWTADYHSSIAVLSMFVFIVSTRNLQGNLMQQQRLPLNLLSIVMTLGWKQ